MFLPGPTTAYPVIHHPGTRLCLHLGHAAKGVHTRRNNMPTMDAFHSAILEGHWQGLCAYEIAHQLAADPVIVARIIDDFETLGF